MFERGRTYRRNQIHLAYDGTRQLQQQGGILTPQNQPFLIVITGESGRRHGYHDFWDNGVLNYYGAGQTGPMQWRSPNTQLRDHVELGKDIHVFEEVPGGLRYRGQFVNAGHEERDNVPDTQGNPRRAFIFRLVPLEDIDSEPPSPQPDGTPAPMGTRWTMPLSELRSRAQSALAGAVTSTEAKRKVWERSEDVKVYVRRRANGRCEGCDAPAPFTDRGGNPYLEPHHAERLTDGGPDDVGNVIALCPTCHRRVHHASDGRTYNETLLQKLVQIEPQS